MRPGTVPAIPTGPAGRPTLGVLGGMGPAATAEFLRLLAVDAPASRDQDHPRIVMLSDPGVPDRSEAILRGDPEPGERIRRDLRTLAGWGADLLAVPCNTAHAFLDDTWTAAPDVPVVDIVDATLRAAAARSGASWLMATSGTVRCGIYQRRARRCGHRLLVPGPEDQQRIDRAARLVKAGCDASAAACLGAAVRRLWEREDVPVLGGCTELPLAYAGTGLPPARMVSSLRALSAACLAALYPSADLVACPATG